MKLLVLGATSAIAQEVARNFAADRAEILLVGRNRARLEAICNDLGVRGARRAELLVSDLGDVKGHEALLDEATELLGGMDAALIAHGTLGDQRKSEASVDAMLDELNTNALSYL